MTPRATEELWTWVEHELEKPGNKYLLRDFILEDGVHVIAGPPTIAYKSWALYALGLALASGQPTCGLVPYYPEGVPVWWLQLESPGRATAERFVSLKNGLGITSMKESYISHLSAHALDAKKDVTEICNFIAEKGIKCLFVDTLAKARSRGSENSADDIGVLFRQVDRIRALGCSTVFSHHVRKLPQDLDVSEIDIDQMLRGSTAIAGAYDLTVGILPDTTPGQLRWIRRTNEDEEIQFQVRWEGCGTEATFPVIGEWDEAADAARKAESAFDGIMPGTKLSVKKLKHVLGLDGDELVEYVEGWCIAGRLEPTGKPDTYVKVK